MCTLNVDRLSIGYGTSVVVDELSFSVNTGEVVGILGPNGTGKSSVLAAIRGHLEALDGSVSLNGLVLDAMSAWERARLGVASHLQGGSGVPGLSLEHNIRVLLFRAPGSARRVFEKRFNECLEHLGLGDLPMTRPIQALSGGERQMALLSATLSLEAEVYLLDEPLAGLSQEMGLAASQLLKESSMRGALVIADHDNTALDLFSRRVALGPRSEDWKPRGEPQDRSYPDPGVDPL